MTLEVDKNEECEICGKINKDVYTKKVYCDCKVIEIDDGTTTLVGTANFTYCPDCRHGYVSRYRNHKCPFSRSDVLYYDFECPHCILDTWHVVCDESEAQIYRSAVMLKCDTIPASEWTCLEEQPIKLVAPSDWQGGGTLECTCVAHASKLSDSSVKVDIPIRCEGDCVFVTYNTVGSNEERNDSIIVIDGEEYAVNCYSVNIKDENGHITSMDMVVHNFDRVKPTAPSWELN